MKPTNLDRIEFTRHAEAKLAGLPVDEDFVRGRIHAKHTEFFRDSDGDAGRYNGYWHDKKIAACFQIERTAEGDKIACIVSVFRVPDPPSRFFYNDRFSRIEV